MTKEFFSKENLINAIWAILIAFFGFIGGSVWDLFSGPEKVVIERNNDSAKVDTTVTILKFEGDSTMLKAFQNYNRVLEVEPKKDIINRNFASVAKLKLNMPSIVKGYKKHSINPYAIVDLPRKTYTKSEIINLDLIFLNKETLLKISPIFIDIVKEKSKNSMIQIWEQQYRITNISNSIRFASNFPKGEYMLSIGFYFMDELEEEFPFQYTKTYKIKII